MTKQNLLAGISSAISFLVFYNFLKWHLIVSLLLAIGIFVGIYLVAKPVHKIGDIEIENLKDGMALHRLYADALNDLIASEEAIKQFNNSALSNKAQQLISTGRDILNYLSENPRELSKSRHFLEYYFETSKKIIQNYSQLKKANISANKFIHIEKKTDESLDLLNQLFENQRDSYHEDKVMALEVETELLEKTIKLSGGDH